MKPIKKINLDVAYTNDELINFLINVGKEYNLTFRFENDSYSESMLFVPNITFYGFESDLKVFYIEEFEPDYTGDFSELLED